VFFQTIRFNGPKVTAKENIILAPVSDKLHGHAYMWFGVMVYMPIPPNHICYYILSQPICHHDAGCMSIINNLIFNSVGMGILPVRE
jgi:hypothetical protein